MNWNPGKTDVLFQLRGPHSKNIRSLIWNELKGKLPMSGFDDDAPYEKYGINVWNVMDPRMDHLRSDGPAAAVTVATRPP